MRSGWDGFFGFGIMRGKLGGNASELGMMGTRVWEEGFVLEVQRGDHGWGIGSALGGAGEITSVMM